MTIQLSRYEARKQRGIAEYKWRRKQKAHYENLVVLFDGIAIAFGFWLVMALVKGDTDLITLGFICMGLSTALLWGQSLNDKAHSFFYSDTPKMFIPKVLDFIEALRYSKSEGNSSERRKEMKFLVRRAVVGVVIAPVVASAYVAFVAVLIGLGAGSSFGVEQAWSNGFAFGIASAVVFAFYPQIARLVESK